MGNGEFFKIAASVLSSLRRFPSPAFPIPHSPPIIFVTMPPLLVLLGPTASGKSALAMEIARRIRAQILSVDSMQVYRHMDIGTAKPSSAEQREIPHHCIDLVDPDQSFTAARFVQQADQTIADTHERGVPLIAAGGTPLYYKSLFQGLFEGPTADPALRERLKALGQDQLHRRLARVDPQAAQRIHPNDTRRMVRALEVHELTGQSISSLQNQWRSPPTRHEALWIGLGWERDALNRRINARVKIMLEAGWLQEVRQLLDRYPRLSKTAAEATGYHELIDHLESKITLSDAVERIKIATRQLARRQMKWFRRYENVHWLDGSAPLEQLITQTLTFHGQDRENRG
jgi:tRNA dimethylallyltransferase